MTVPEFVDGAVATLTLDRPEALNALTVEMLDQLGEAQERLGAELPLPEGPRFEAKTTFELAETEARVARFG